MTDQPLADTSDGVWDDGEWISWDWINAQLEDQELRKAFPSASPDVVRRGEPLPTAQLAALAAELDHKPKS